MTTKRTILYGLIAVIFALIFAACGDDGKDGEDAGTDGTNGTGGNGTWTWTAISSTFAITVEAIAYENGKFVAGGWQGKMATSSDGITWTAVADSTFPPTFTYGSSYSPDTTDITAIAYGGGKFVAGGTTAGKMAYSTDGITWTAADSTFSAYYSGTSTVNPSVFKGIAYGGDKFVAVGEGYNRKMAYSNDGVTWTVVEFQNLDNISINAIAYGGGKFVTVGNNVTNLGNISNMASNNGENWTRMDTFTSNSGGITYVNDRFVAKVGAGYVYYSTDGITWIAVTDSIFGDARNYAGIAYGGGKFVAVGGSGGIAYADSN